MFLKIPKRKRIKNAMGFVFLKMKLNKDRMGFKISNVSKNEIERIKKKSYGFLFLKSLRTFIGRYIPSLKQAL